MSLATANRKKAILACPPINWRATLTKPTEVGYFQSVSTDFVLVAQHFNAGQESLSASGEPAKKVTGNVGKLAGESQIVGGTFAPCR
ncbi:MAG: hypothetical protein SLRJCFUN_000562 [Candidatus Fervidibacter sp.]|jgi:hypothetical protein